MALHSTGRPAEGIGVLEQAHQRFTGDTEILLALATMEHDRGRREAAVAYARTLVELVPEDPQARALMREFER